jgi:F420-non-reducing hydrogenase iron-sulfur subunit
MTGNGFEPRIVGFLCNWCSYQGADMAGTARMQYAPNVHIIRVNCSGRVDPSFILKAFREGADGVIVAGCHPGDCHYTSGNYKTMRRMPLLERLLADFGIEPGRFRLEWVSAAEGAKWARLVNEVTELVRQLGPLNWKEQINKSANLQICPAEGLRSNAAEQHGSRPAGQPISGGGYG